jgi:hypothetical protein
LFGPDVHDVVPLAGRSYRICRQVAAALNRVRRRRLNNLADARNTHRLSEVTVNPNEYLQKFFAELEGLVDGYGTRHTISTSRTGQLEVRLGAGDWYWAAQVTPDDGPIEAAQRVAKTDRYFPTKI